MAWELSYLSEHGVVVTSYIGLIEQKALEEAVLTTIAMGQRYEAIRFLADCRNLEGGHSIVDLFDLVKMLDGMDLPLNVREAIVLPQLEAAASDVLFWETACRNRGINVRVFNCMEHALAWLTESEHPVR